VLCGVSGTPFCPAPLSSRNTGTHVPTAITA
jgi:hypothetical protein